MLRRVRERPQSRASAERVEDDPTHGRRVVRTIRRIELWTVFRLSAFVYLALYVVGMFAFVLLWWIAGNTGTTGNIESFLRDVGFKQFVFNGPKLFLAVALGGLVFVFAATLLTTVLAALVNVISELTGGIRLVVIESPTADSERVKASEPAGPPRSLPPFIMPGEEPPVPHHQLRAATGTANPRRAGTMGFADHPEVASNGAPDVIDHAGAGVENDGPSWAERAARLLRRDARTVRTDDE